MSTKRYATHTNTQKKNQKMSQTLPMKFIDLPFDHPRTRRRGGSSHATTYSGGAIRRS
jgi:hypothetical protein